MKQKEILTARLCLRPFREEDMEALYGLLTNEEIKKTYMIPDFPSREAADKMCRRFVDLSLDEGHFVRGIYLENGLIGFLNDVEIRDGTIELGYVIHPDHWNRGFATAALQKAITQLFVLGYREIITGAFAENTASLRVMEKAGMVRMEKTDTIEYRGTTHSCIYYSIAKSDPTI